MNRIKVWYVCLWLLSATAFTATMLSGMNHRNAMAHPVVSDPDVDARTRAKCH